MNLLATNSKTIRTVDIACEQTRQIIQSSVAAVVMIQTIKLRRNGIPAAIKEAGFDSVLL